MIDANALFAIVEDVAPSPGEGAVRIVGCRDLAVDVLHVGRGRRADVRHLVAAGGAIARGGIDGDTNWIGEGACQFSRARQRAARLGGVGDDLPPLLRIEEEGFVLLLVIDAGNVNRAADGEAEIVPPHFRAGRDRGGAVVEKVVGVKNVVPEKLVSIAMELAGASARHDVDFAAGAATVFRQIVGTQHVELGDRVNTGIGKEGEVSAAIDVVGAVDLPVVLGGTSAVNRKVDLVRRAHWVAHSDKKLVGGEVGGYTRQRSYELFVVAGNQGELTHLVASHKAGGGGVVEIDLGGGLVDADGLSRAPNLQMSIDGESIVHVQNNVVGFEIAEALHLHRDFIVTDGEVCGSEVATRIAFDGANNGIAIGVGNFNGCAGDGGPGRVIHDSANVAGDLLCTKQYSGQT